MAPSNGADDAQWPKDRLSRVMDVSENRKSFEKLTEDIIRECYRDCGPISSIFPWTSNARKSHFYVEFQSQAGCDEAREMAIPGVHTASIESDSQHRKRLISLTSKPSNHRYSPYELRSVGTSRASLSVATQQGGSASSHHGDQNHPQSSRSNLFYDPNGAWDETFLDNGDQSVASKDPLITPFRLTPPMVSLQSIPETIDIPVFGETVKFPANSASTSSGIAALLQSTSGHDIQFGSEAMPFLSNPTLPSTQNTPSSRSSELSVEEMLEVLTEARNRKREEKGQDASTSATRPPRQFQIHPKFDFRQHIMSGRFLNPDYVNGLQDESVNEPSFQLTPLQAYFADIYASLQTELHHTKRRNRQDLLLLEKQRILTEQYKQEAADERNARRRAEQALGALQEQCDRGEAMASAHQLAAEKSEARFREVKGQLDELKGDLDKIGFVWTKARADKTPP